VTYDTDALSKRTLLTAVLQVGRPTLEKLWHPSSKQAQPWGEPRRRTRCGHARLSPYVRVLQHPRCYANMKSRAPRFTRKVRGESVASQARK
jgi:hypothetical protein